MTEPITEPTKFGREIGQRTRKELSKMEQDQIRAEERERIANIEVLCRHFNIEPEKQRAMIDNGTSMEEARKVVLDIETSRLPSGIGYRGPIDDGGHPATIIKDESEKFRDAASDGLAIRANIPVKQPAPGANHYVGDTLLSIAKDCCTQKQHPRAWPEFLPDHRAGPGNVRLAIHSVECRRKSPAARPYGLSVSLQATVPGDGHERF